MQAEAIRTTRDTLLARFEAAGAVRIEADILQPAATLLDLYGEDIRGRAYVTQDPLRGEQMLRPDFTVPVVQMHMAAKAEPARYTYAGPVFRRQESETGRPSEYPQVGFEVFDRAAPEGVEAALFAEFHGALAGLPVRAVIGDMAILRAAVEHLETTPARKAALMRHLWRPTRFRDLLDRFADVPSAPENVVSGPVIGLRSGADVAARLARLDADRAAPPLAESARTALEHVMSIKGPAPAALKALKVAARDMAGIAGEVARLAARLDALSDAGIDPATLDFEVSYGRTSMEYYDGFVFGFTAADLPPVATGGRYDALTRVLGQGRYVPAVGGVIRPDLVAALKGGM